MKLVALTLFVYNFSLLFLYLIQSKLLKGPVGCKCGAVEMLMLSNQAWRRAEIWYRWCHGMYLQIMFLQLSYKIKTVSVTSQMWITLIYFWHSVIFWQRGGKLSTAKISTLVARPAGCAGPRGSQSIKVFVAMWETGIFMQFCLVAHSLGG